MANIKQGLRIVPMPLYCGLLRPAPNDRTIGTPTECFKQGLRSGFVAGIQKGKKQEKTKQKTREVLTASLTRQQVAKEIEDKGLNFLKSHLSLDKLNKDLIRSLCTKLTGTEQAIPRYSTMTREQLVQNLVERGFKR